jgi:HD-GYP domain-containing protein (c-di-GMP phosphodiesterase class II)
VQALQRCGENEVFAAKDLDELVEAGVVQSFDRSQLQVGKRSDRGVMTKAGRIVLEPGQEVEAHHLDALAAGGEAYSTDGAMASHERRERILLADTLVEELMQEIKFLELRVEPSSDQSWIKPQPSETWPGLEKLTELRASDVDRLRICYAHIEAGMNVSVNEFKEIVSGLLDRLAGYSTRFTQLALLCPRRQDYLPDHAYTVTVLAMAIGQQLKWSRHDIAQLGLAGLVFDLGMLLVPERIRTGACELTDIDRSRVQRHSIFSLAMLQEIQTVEPVIQLTALQHHERENGSGYPRGIRRDATCDYARVLAVADSFAATTEPRHYRRPKLPYVAMEETLRSTSAMTLWKPAVKALLQAAGLFPVGSYVKLSDGSNAHVLASNPTRLDRPLVQLVDIDGGPKGEPVDLAQIPNDTLSVTRPIASATG